MMKNILSTFLLAAALPATAQEMKKLDIRFDDMAAGAPPEQVFVIDGNVQIAEKDGGKALVIDPGTELVEGAAQLGDSAAGNASVQVKVLASKQGRSTPRFGISVHGMSGYRFYVNPAKKQLELIKADQTVASAPFIWKSDAWLYLKLEVKKAAGDAWYITASAWPAADTAAPAEPQLKHSDKGLKGQGKCTLWATPFSGKPVYFDDAHVEVETAPAAAK